MALLTLDAGQYGVFLWSIQEATIFCSFQVSSTTAFLHDVTSHAATVGLKTVQVTVGWTCLINGHTSVCV